MDSTKDVPVSWQIPERLRLALLAALSADPAHVATMTYDEFLERADEDTLAEWVDGARAQRLIAGLTNAGFLPP